MPPSGGWKYLSTIWTSVSGAINQDIGARSQDFDPELGLATTGTRKVLGNEESVVMVEPSVLSPAIMFIGLGMWLVYVVDRLSE
jgi:hypothetical protein